MNIAYIINGAIALGIILMFAISLPDRKTAGFAGIADFIGLIFLLGFAGMFCLAVYFQYLLGCFEV